MMSIFRNVSDCFGISESPFLHARHDFADRQFTEPSKTLRERYGAELLRVGWVETPFVLSDSLDLFRVFDVHQSPARIHGLQVTLIKDGGPQFFPCLGRKGLVR